MPAARRLLLVHAHPDDETINNGATMARYAAEGAHVTLVTCTRGERGEVIPPSLAHLEGDGDELGRHREGELAAAMAALGVTDHRFLGAPRVVYRDSGMAYAADGSVVPAPDTEAGAFAVAPPDQAAGHLAEVLREVRPHVVVTYEPGGGYGHPDHVRAHEVTMRAVDLAGSDAAVAWVVRPASTEAADPPLVDGRPAPGPTPSMVVPDADVTTVVDASAHVAAKTAALRAHATQVVVQGDRYALSNGVSRRITGVEHYRVVRGRVPADGLFPE